MNPWTYSLALTRFAIEAQTVIALRMMRLAAGGALAQREAGRMVIEKGEALAKSQMAAAAALASGGGPRAAGTRAFGTYKRAVSKNRRRLSRRL
ncbi:MAG: hypothetical protein JO084_01635 [Bradyrhizobiaceae bacterium]|nr:hypothetical protein [Hyphomicrobiales bacterium]MBV9426411.1 hypothetical protein [Bradyrhizobiaceae bacterium]